MAPFLLFSFQAAEKLHLSCVLTAGAQHQLTEASKLQEDAVEILESSPRVPVMKCKKAEVAVLKLGFLAKIMPCWEWGGCRPKQYHLIWCSFSQGKYYWCQKWSRLRHCLCSTCHPHFREHLFEVVWCVACWVCSKEHWNASLLRQTSVWLSFTRMQPHSHKYQCQMGSCCKTAYAVCCHMSTVWLFLHATWWNG